MTRVQGTESDPAPAGQQADLRVVPLGHLVACPVQPRLNVSMRLVEQLAGSMEAGRHQPLLEVESLLEQPGRYQIVCGEQRWRAALQAGMPSVLVRVLPRLTYLDRLRKQLEENRLRAALDPVEEAHAIVLTRTLLEIATLKPSFARSTSPATAATVRFSWAETTWQPNCFEVLSTPRHEHVPRSAPSCSTTSALPWPGSMSSTWRAPPFVSRSISLQKQARPCTCSGWRVPSRGSVLARSRARSQSCANG